MTSFHGFSHVSHWPENLDKICAYICTRPWAMKQEVFAPFNGPKGGEVSAIRRLGSKGTVEEEHETNAE